MRFRSRNFAVVGGIAVFLLPGAFTLGACTQPGCIDFTYYIGGDGSGGWAGYGVIDVDGKTPLKSAASAMWTPRNGWSKLNANCLQCKWQYGCDVDPDCPSTQYPCTATLKQNGGCPNKIGPIGYFYCTGS